MWKPIEGADHLYELEKIEASGWCWRSLAVRLTDGTLLVVSPIAGTLAALDALGRPSFALAPNHFHHLGLPELRKKFPELRCVASDVAKKRLVGKRGHAFEALDAVRDRLPSGVELLAPEGLKSGEVFVRAQTSRGVAWAVSDAFFNVEHAVRGPTGFVLRATSTVPGLRIGDTFRWLALGDGARYRKWIDARLAADPPSVLIPGHGSIVAGEALPSRIAELVARRT